MIQSARFVFLAVTLLCGCVLPESVSATPGILVTKRNRRLFEQWEGSTYCYFRNNGTTAVPGKLVRGPLPGRSSVKGNYFQSYALQRTLEIERIRNSGRNLSRIVDVRFRYQVLIGRYTALCGLPRQITAATTSVLQNAANPDDSLTTLNSLVLDGMNLYDPSSFFLKAEEAMLAAFQTRIDFDILPTLLANLKDYYSVTDLTSQSKGDPGGGGPVSGGAEECADFKDVVAYQVGSGQDNILRAIATSVLLSKLAKLTSTVEIRFWVNRDLYHAAAGEQLCRQFMGPASLPYVSAEQNSKIAKLPAKLQRLAKAYQSAFNRCLTLHSVAADSVQSYPAWLSAAQAFTPSSTAAENLSGLLSQDVISGRQVMVLSHGVGVRTVKSALDLVPTDDEGDQKTALGVVAVAPAAALASQAALGAFSYYTLATDMVLGLAGAPGANLQNEMSARNLDPAYYRNAVNDLAYSYLFSSESRTPLVDSLTSQSLALTNSRANAGQGYFQVTLRWNVAGDIDLHVLESVSGGKYVYFGAKQGTVGQLDRDDIPGSGPENYYVCSKEQMLPGDYVVWVNNYSNGGSVVSQITIRAGRSVKTFSVAMDAANGKTYCLPVASVRYADGQFTITDTTSTGTVYCGPS